MPRRKKPIEEPERKMVYEHLLRQVRNGAPALNIHLHRYLAVVGGVVLGRYSNFGAACKTVDARSRGLRGAWKITLEEGKKDYVMDNVTWQTYCRTAPVPASQQKVQTEATGATEAKV